ncbi:hypothetical protein [Gudongella sp. DL1XJH-153]|jgi:hypothetical protein|uniref:hypothetical protein n=1 Tax=Gudongella sp. DL1XJH-153 TaxID=3409804 RepID=UPI003BB5B4AB
MKKASVFMAFMLALTMLSTGTVFAAENGFEAKASDKNPAFEDMEDMHDMDMECVINVNNNDLHFSSMGHIMIPGNAADNTESPIFDTMDGMDMGHLSPPDRVK